MKYTGERLIPGETDDARMCQEHIIRYAWAMHPYCTHRKVLDFSCGAGYGTQILSWAAEAALGADRDPETIAYANRYYHNPKTVFTICEAANLRNYMGRDKFDVVVSFETIEHLKEPIPFVQQVGEVLVPGGLFIVSAPEKSGSVWHVRDYTKQDLFETLLAGYWWESYTYFAQDFGAESLIVKDGPGDSAHPTHIFVCQKGQHEHLAIYDTASAIAAVPVLS